MLYALFLVLLILVAWQLIGCALQRTIIFPRHVIPNAVLRPEPRVEQLEKVWIDIPDGRVEAWFIAGDGASAEHPAPAVIFAHGNGEVIDVWPEVMQTYARLGISVMLCEYRGYGRSDGSPSQQAITEDFIAFYDWLVARREVDEQSIIFHGRSLGGGVVCDLATQRRPAAMILQSTFTGITDITSRLLFLSWLVFDPYNNAAVVKQYDGPILLMHGVADRIISVSHSRKLDAIAPNSTLIEYECGHNDFPVTSPRFWQDIAHFLEANDLLPGLRILETDQPADSANP
jgi:hypothetical protein